MDLPGARPDRRGAGLGAAGVVLLLWFTGTATGGTRRMKIRIAALLAALSAWPNAAYAQYHAQEITRLCTADRNRPSTGELGRLIESLHSHYASVPPSRRDADRAVGTIESILAQTSFASVLDCPAQVEALGYDFHVNTDAEGDWHVRSTHNSVSLNMSLHSDATSSITGYLHEMVHVCQFADERRSALRDRRRELLEIHRNTLDDLMPSLIAFNEGNAEVNREEAFLGIVGEVEAFLAMTHGYRELVRASPQMCGAPNQSPAWYEVWAESEQQLVSGTFAQSKIINYVENPRYAEHIDVILDSSAPRVPYFDGYGRSYFELAPLTSRLRVALAELGVPVRDFPMEVRAHQLAFEIQYLLQQANCYSGRLDNIWGPMSRNALERFTRAAGAAFDSYEPNSGMFIIVRIMSQATDVRCG